MDGIIEKFDRLDNKLEMTLEILLDHIRDQEERLEQLEDTIEELKNGER